MNTKASVIIVTYNSLKYVANCIESIVQNQPLEIIVVDNASTDGTPEFLNRCYSNVNLVISNKNLGYGTANNLGAKHAVGEYLVFLNPDTKMAPNCLRELLAPLGLDKMISTPKIMLYDASGINTCGNINHFTGLSFVRGLYEDASAYCESKYVSGISGACFALKRADYEEIGGFDENFFLYYEDSDFSWRALLRGYRIFFTHNAVVMHDYTFKVPPKKVYLVEKARYVMLRKYLDKKDVMALLPSLIIAEVLTWGYVIGLGWKGMYYKYRGMRDGLTLEVEKIYGDKKNLVSYLEAAIPMVRLTNSRFESLARNLCNRVFLYNYNRYAKQQLSQFTSTISK